MKYSGIFLTLLFFFFVTATGCSGGNDVEPVDSITVPDELLNSGMKLSADEQTQSFSVTATAGLQVSSSASWCRPVASPRSGSEYSIDVAVDKNTDAAARSAVITLVSGKATRSVRVIQDAAAVAPDPTPTPQPSGFVSSASVLGLGWNLGNHFDAYAGGVASETCWGNGKATQATFNAVKAAGFTSVRIPVTWLGHVGDAPEYTIDPDWLRRVGEVVGYAKNAGLKAIINIHHDGAEGANWLNPKDCANDARLNTATKARIAAMWHQIAGYFADEGDYLMFEAFNEIHDGGWGWGDNRKDGGKQYNILNQWNQTFVDAVRSAGGHNADRWLGVPGYCTNIDLTVQHLVMPVDPAKNRIMVAVHDYSPIEFTLNATRHDWGHTSASAPDGSDEAYFKRITDLLDKNFTQKGIPVYIGEFGCGHHAEQRAEKFRAYYLEYVSKSFHDGGFAAIVWDNGSTGAGKECHGYFDHATGDYINNAAEMVAAMVRGYTDAPGYTLQSVYNSAPR